MRAFLQEYSPPPHCKARRRQIIEAKAIVKAGRSNIAIFLFQVDFLGGLRWIKKITTKYVGPERIGFIQNIHRHVVPDMIPPPTSGPAINATPDIAPTMPLKGATLDRGTECDRIVSTPDKMPPAPSPAIARPLRKS